MVLKKSTDMSSAALQHDVGRDVSGELVRYFYLLVLGSLLMLFLALFIPDCVLVDLGELLVPDEGLLAGELPPTQQTGQFHPVSHPPFLLFFVASFVFAVSFSAVGWDQTLLLRRGPLQK
ncbi:hypothetical protein EYF80_007477 [Liparis tanakae]|uniref:Uncharacterized protein n=1 Tax=Liparis tanakae TaxID=230148 RepID=A0A4Z2IWV7_9TELE|nr:hypothetical protein EYF80_007477 [Liparis tanakae]